MQILKVSAGKRGFTLIELLIVVVIIAVLAVLAAPSFMGQVRKARRADAVAAISQIQQAQERFRANCPCYAHSMTNATSPTCPAACPGSGGDAGLGLTVGGTYYNYSVGSVTASGYVLNANAVSTSSQGRDTGCTTLTVTVAAGSATRAPAACWSN
jgi:type IV pilus assembly protein PilE